MLARNAEALYWIGRYVERADDTARILDVSVHKLLEDSSVDPDHTSRIAKYHEPADAVVAAAQWVRSELEHLPGSTGVHFSGLDALREGKGVCQDFAHLSLIILRSMGIPARYVSGYLHPDRNPGTGDPVDGQSHAWIQAWTVVGL